MRKLQQLCAATTLLFVLSLPALAGEIHTNVFSPPPPALAGEIHTEVVSPPPPATATAQNYNATDGLIESETLISKITLSLLQLLTVF